MNRAIELLPGQGSPLLLAATFLLLSAATWLTLIAPKQSNANSLDTTIKQRAGQLAHETTTRTPPVKATHKHARLPDAMLRPGPAEPGCDAADRAPAEPDRDRGARLARLDHPADAGALRRLPGRADHHHPLRQLLQHRGLPAAAEEAGSQREPDRARPQPAACTTSWPSRSTSTTPAPKVSATLTIDAFAYTGFGFVTPGGQTTTSGTPTPGRDGGEGERYGRARAQDAEADEATPPEDLRRRRRRRSWSALVGFQLPGLLGSSSPSGTADRRHDSPTCRARRDSRSSQTASSSPVPRWIRAIGRAGTSSFPRSSSSARPAAARQRPRPQPRAVRPSGQPTASSRTLRPPDRAAGGPSRPRPSPHPRRSPVMSHPPAAGRAAATSSSCSSIPGIGGGASEKAAARGVVAAENAGLQDVAANDAVPGRPDERALHRLHGPVPDRGNRASPSSFVHSATATRRAHAQRFRAARERASSR